MHPQATELAGLRNRGDHCRLLLKVDLLATSLSLDRMTAAELLQGIRKTRSHNQELCDTRT